MVNEKVKVIKDIRHLNSLRDAKAKRSQSQATCIAFAKPTKDDIKKSKLSEIDHVFLDTRYDNTALHKKIDT